MNNKRRKTDDPKSTSINNRNLLYGTVSKLGWSAYMDSDISLRGYGELVLKSTPTPKAHSNSPAHFCAGLRLYVVCIFDYLTPAISSSFLFPYSFLSFLTSKDRSFTPFTSSFIVTRTVPPFIIASLTIIEATGVSILF